MTTDRKPLPLPRGALDGCVIDDDASVVDPATLSGEVVIAGPKPPPLTVLVSDRMPVARVRADDASRARLVADNVRHALDVTLGAAQAMAEGRNPFAILALATAEQADEARRFANGKPAPHCRHGWHFGRRLHTGRQV